MKKDGPAGSKKAVRANLRQPLGRAKSAPPPSRNASSVDGLSRQYSRQGGSPARRPKGAQMPPSVARLSRQKSSESPHSKRRLPKPKTCACAAYAWPHRPGGGLCRWPNPPKRTCLTPAGTNRRGTARARKGRNWMFTRYGLNPVADRDEFARLYPVLRDYIVTDLADARRQYRWLKRHAPHELSREEPGHWRVIPRDRFGRWRSSRTAPPELGNGPMAGRPTNATSGRATERRLEHRAS